MIQNKKLQMAFKKEKKKWNIPFAPLIWNNCSKEHQWDVCLLYLTVFTFKKSGKNTIFLLLVLLSFIHLLIPCLHKVNIC